jgi:hypothetical protein
MASTLRLEEVIKRLNDSLIDVGLQTFFAAGLRAGTSRQATARSRGLADRHRGRHYPGSNGPGSEKPSIDSTFA